MTNNDKEKADTLGQFFASVFTSEPHGSWELKNCPEVKKQLAISISEGNILKRLSKIKISKSPGPDNVHPRVLYELRHSLAKPLCIIFNTSLNTGELPSIWKEANISAIHKKGSKQLAGNYRPVSLTSIVCKLLEAIIRDAIITYMKANNFFSNKQFVFLSGRSTVLQLLKVVDKWS